MQAFNEFLSIKSEPGIGTVRIRYGVVCGVKLTRSLMKSWIRDKKDFLEYSIYVLYTKNETVFVAFAIRIIIVGTATILYLPLDTKSYVTPIKPKYSISRRVFVFTDSMVR